MMTFSELNQLLDAKEARLVELDQQMTAAAVERMTLSMELEGLRGQLYTTFRAASKIPGTDDYVKVGQNMQALTVGPEED